MTRALVTRPAEDSADLIRELEARRISVLAEPLLTIRAKDGVAVDTAGVQALLFTSANGVRAFASASTVRDLPAFAVGDATAETLRTQGFAKIESARGDVADLERLVRRRLDPTRGKLLHAAGSSVAGDLAGRLASAGFEVDRVQLYDADPAETLSEAARAEIASGRIDWVLVFSPRTAASFASVIERAGLAEATRRMTLLALSKAVAEAAKLPFQRVVIATEPTQAALLASVDGLTAKAPMTEPKPVPPPPLPPPPRANRTPLILAAAALGLAVVAVGLAMKPGAVTMPASAPTVDLAPLTQRFDKIEATLVALGQRLEGVASEARQAGAKASAAAEAATTRPAESGAAPPPVDLAPIEKRLSDLEQMLTEVGRRTASVTDAERRLAEVERRAASITDAERRLTEVERLAKADRHVDTAALAALKVGEALAAGRPYKAELALLSAVPGIETEMRTLSARADTGIPSRAVLAERLPAAAAAASRSAGRDDGIWGQIVSKAQNLAQVRRITPGDDLDGRLAEAETAMKAGDLARALAALDRLPEPAAKALAPWRADAQARLEAERALDRLTQALAAGFARGG